MLALEVAGGDCVAACYFFDSGFVEEATFAGFGGGDEPGAVQSHKVVARRAVGAGAHERVEGGGDGVVAE